jgi:hypothetical protein
MTLKEKIALNGLKRRLDRGAVSLADAMAEYRKITGQDPDDEFVNSEDSDIDPENSEISSIDEKKTEAEYKGYSPPGVTTEPVQSPNQTDSETQQPLSEEMKEVLGKYVQNTVGTVIEKVKAQKETSPKRVDTQRTAKKTEDPK